MNSENEVYKILNELKIEYDIHVHPAVYTIEEAEKYTDGMKGARVKNLFLRNGKGNCHYLLIVNHDKKINLKLLSESLGEKRLSFASENRLKKYLSVSAGSVSPLGLINDKNNEVFVVFDKELTGYDFINAHPNINTKTLTMKFQDLQRVINYIGNEYSIMQIE